MSAMIQTIPIKHLEQLRYRQREKRRERENRTAKMSKISAYRSASDPSYVLVMRGRSGHMIAMYRSPLIATSVYALTSTETAWV